MNTEIVIAAPSQVPSLRYSSDEVELIKNTICKGASDNELKLFLHQCQRTGLDALARQIYAVMREIWDPKTQSKKMVMSIQTSIDGFRLIAERSGKYAGQLRSEWCGPDGKWTDVWLENAPPKAARVGVLRSDFKEPLWAVARWESYAQSFINKKTNKTDYGTMWKKMPDLMLAKCAETLALRKAFPQELSGLYTSDEMEQADNEETPSLPSIESKPEPRDITPVAQPMPAPKAAEKPKLPPNQTTEWFAIGKEVKAAAAEMRWSDTELVAYVKMTYKKTIGELTCEELKQVLFTILNPENPEQEARDQTFGRNT